MKYIAAYNLALVCDEKPTAQKIKEILNAAHVSCDDAELKHFLDLVGEQAPHTIIAAGKKMLA